MSITVTLLGATGLVGGEALRLLLAHSGVARVVTVGRRALPPSEAAGAARARLVERVVDMEHLAAHADAFAADAVICALGTTIRQAGSQQGFRRVDYDMPLAAARIALDRGAPHFLLVSALGANAASRVFYNRVKGEIERDVLALPFRSTTILRPSLLLGSRAEVRTGEEVGKALGWLVPGKYRPVRARDVARVLVQRALAAEPGARVIESAEIRSLARQGGDR